jgi:hypothetical protein
LDENIRTIFKHSQHQEIPMSAFLHDIPSNAAFAALVPAGNITANGSGSAVGPLPGEGQEFAIVQIGTPSSGATVTVTIEQSDDLSAWTAVGGASTGSRSAAAVVPLTYTRSQAYVRARYTVSGSSPSIPLAAAVGQQKKLW